ITGDSPNEQISYLAWIRRAQRTFALRLTPPTLPGIIKGVKQLAAFVHLSINGQLGTDLPAIHDSHASRAVPEPIFFPLYEHTTYSVGAHEGVLKSLGFRFDDAFWGTETDCTNPLLMLHLRGLRYECVHHLLYAQGVNEYLELWRSLMTQKRFPS